MMLMLMILALTESAPSTPTMHTVPSTVKFLSEIMSLTGVRRLVRLIAVACQRGY